MVPTGGLNGARPPAPSGRRPPGCRMRPSDTFCLEELCPRVLDGRNHECPVEKVVVLLTRRFRDQQATVAGRAVQEAALVLALGIVLGAHRVVGTQPPE